MSIAIEAAERMERFQWLTTEEAQSAVADPAERAAVADEAHRGWVRRHRHLLPQPEQRFGCGRQFSRTGQTANQRAPLPGGRGLDVSSAERSVAAFAARSGR